MLSEYIFSAYLQLFGKILKLGTSHFEKIAFQYVKQGTTIIIKFFHGNIFSWHISLDIKDNDIVYVYSLY